MRAIAFFSWPLKQCRLARKILSANNWFCWGESLMPLRSSPKTRISLEHPAMLGCWKLAPRKTIKSTTFKKRELIINQVSENFDGYIRIFVDLSLCNTSAVKG